MELDRDQLQKDIHALYAREHEEMGEAGTLERLEQGAAMSQKFDLVKTLTSGGVVVFPHAGVLECGHQIAAAAIAALDAAIETGKKVLVISVLHAFSAKMETARRNVAAGGDFRDEEFWGIQGPGVVNGRIEWTGDHALISWRHFWNAEIERRGIDNPPEMIERYPYLAGGKPEQLKGIQELQEIARDAVIVSTADAFHHGIGYGDAPEDSYHPDEEGIAYARSVLEQGVAILERGDYWGYNQHCVTAKSDARDAGQVFRYLLGPLKGTVEDIVPSDGSSLYNTPAPTWVAAALFNWKPA